MHTGIDSAIEGIDPGWFVFDPVLTGLAVFISTAVVFTLGIAFRARNSND